MYKDLKDSLDNKIVKLHGNNFQDFINKLFQLFYREEYIPIRQQHDRGNDGCLKDKTRMFAVYSPETKTTEKEIEKKFEDDFQKYSTNWKSQGYKRFTFIFNSPEPNIIDITASQQTLANTYNADFWTRGYLLNNIIGKLSFSDIRKLAVDILAMDEQQYRFSIIQWVVEDLVKRNESNIEINYILPIGIEEKIKKNFDVNDVETVKKQALNFHKDFSKLEEILEYEETSKLLKNRILNSYEDTDSGKPFKDRIKILKNNLSNQSQDDDYVYYVECIIFYTFEQCLIGRRND